METPPLTRGRPSVHPATKRSFWKHPRLRGEDGHKKTGRGRKSETPPLTRGRRRPCGRLHGRCRNTPAYAGKTVVGDLTTPQHGKHPRLRGEDLGCLHERGHRWETPPLTRGRRGGSSRRRGESRNTPAYAGKTRRSPCRYAGGSETPPLTRGRPEANINWPKRLGNTPAYAGKTCQPRPPRR